MPDTHAPVTPPSDRGARGRISASKLATAAAVGGLALSAASLVVSGTRAAGTGTHMSRGFPRPYYFTWEAFGGAEHRGGVNWLYLVENWIVWAAAIGVVLLVWRALRQRSAA